MSETADINSALALTMANALGLEITSNKPAKSGNLTKLVRKIKAPAMRKHAFRYAICAHLLHAAFDARHIRQFEAAAAFAATAGTVILHLSEESEEDSEKRIHAIAREEAEKLVTAKAA